MSAKTKSRIAIGLAVMGGLLFLEASMVLGYYPSQFVLPTALALVAAVLGSRWIRVAGVILCAASITMGVHHYERKQHVETLLRGVHERAATNSISK